MHHDAGNTRNPWCVDFVSIFHLLAASSPDILSADILQKLARKEPECLAGCQSRVTTLSPASNDSQPMQNDSHQTGSAKWKNKLC
ncbi:hypothetical protein BofuT4_uP102320.1 [Botrytis cinerea T4]|uniref:Uncharacterized protein n=1 Tax=Botryotinia fuckeliana (strain T4) TaxID=999810 RepID=G2YBE0_BOTF4|nr:hypothetical protein BofuT4_uP102320.1 [Botrytis cinerea T4]